MIIKIASRVSEGDSGGIKVENFDSSKLVARHTTSGDNGISLSVTGEGGAGSDTIVLASLPNIESVGTVAFTKITSADSTESIEGSIKIMTEGEAATGVMVLGSQPPVNNEITLGLNVASGEWMPQVYKFVSPHAMRVSISSSATKQQLHGKYVDVAESGTTKYRFLFYATSGIPTPLPTISGVTVIGVSFYNYESSDIPKEYIAAQIKESMSSVFTGATIYVPSNLTMPVSVNTITGASYFDISMTRFGEMTVEGSGGVDAMYQSIAQVPTGGGLSLSFMDAPSHSAQGSYVDIAIGTDPVKRFWIDARNNNTNTPSTPLGGTLVRVAPSSNPGDVMSGGACASSMRIAMMGAYSGVSYVEVGYQTTLKDAATGEYGFTISTLEDKAISAVSVDGISNIVSHQVEVGDPVSVVSILFKDTPKSTLNKSFLNIIGSTFGYTFWVDTTGTSTEPESSYSKVKIDLSSAPEIVGAQALALFFLNSISGRLAGVVTYISTEPTQVGTEGYSISIVSNDDNFSVSPFRYYQLSFIDSSAYLNNLNVSKFIVNIPDVLALNHGRYFDIRVTGYSTHRICIFGYTQYQGYYNTPEEVPGVILVNILDIITNEMNTMAETLFDFRRYVDENFPDSIYLTRVVGGKLECIMKEGKTISIENGYVKTWPISIEHAFDRRYYFPTWSIADFVEIEGIFFGRALGYPNEERTSRMQYSHFDMEFTRGNGESIKKRYTLDQMNDGYMSRKALPGYTGYNTTVGEYMGWCSTALGGNISNHHYINLYAAASSKFVAGKDPLGEYPKFFNQSYQPACPIYFYEVVIEAIIASLGSEASDFIDMDEMTRVRETIRKLRQNKSFLLGMNNPHLMYYNFASSEVITELKRLIDIKELIYLPIKAGAKVRKFSVASRGRCVDYKDTDNGEIDIDHVVKFGSEEGLELFEDLAEYAETLLSKIKINGDQNGEVDRNEVHGYYFDFVIKNTLVASRIWINSKDDIASAPSLPPAPNETYMIGASASAGISRLIEVKVNPTPEHLIGIDYVDLANAILDAINTAITLKMPEEMDICLCRWIETDTALKQSTIFLRSQMHSAVNPSGNNAINKVLYAQDNTKNIPLSLVGSVLSDNPNKGNGAYKLERLPEEYSYTQSLSGKLDDLYVSVNSSPQNRPLINKEAGSTTLGRCIDSFYSILVSTSPICAVALATGIESTVKTLHILSLFIADKIHKDISPLNYIDIYGTNTGTYRVWIDGDVDINTGAPEVPQERNGVVGSLIRVQKGSTFSGTVSSMVSALSTALPSNFFLSAPIDASGNYKILITAIGDTVEAVASDKVNSITIYPEINTLSYSRAVVTFIDEILKEGAQGTYIDIKRATTEAGIKTYRVWLDTKGNNSRAPKVEGDMELVRAVLSSVITGDSHVVTGARVAAAIADAMASNTNSLSEFQVENTEDEPVVVFTQEYSDQSIIISSITPKEFIKDVSTISGTRNVLTLGFRDMSKVANHGKYIDVRTNLSGWHRYWLNFTGSNPDSDPGVPGSVSGKVGNLVMVGLATGYPDPVPAGQVAGAVYARLLEAGTMHSSLTAQYDESVPDKIKLRASEGATISYAELDGSSEISITEVTPGTADGVGLVGNIIINPQSVSNTSSNLFNAINDKDILALKGKTYSSGTIANKVFNATLSGSLITIEDRIKAKRAAGYITSGITGEGSSLTEPRGGIDGQTVFVLSSTTSSLRGNINLGDNIELTEANLPKGRFISQWYRISGRSCTLYVSTLGAISISYETATSISAIVSDKYAGLGGSYAVATGEKKAIQFPESSIEYLCIHADNNNANAVRVNIRLVVT